VRFNNYCVESKSEFRKVIEMAKCDEMYYKLFRLITEANILLREAQKITEAILLAPDNPDIGIIETDNKINKITLRT